MVELITDRTQYHVALLNRLRRKRWSSMSASEKAAWYGDAAKGAYNYTDLNRVEMAVKELATELGLNLVTKTNWTLWDVPVASEMDRYLGNVVAIRDACPKEVDFPTLPDSMSGLTHEGANSIEEVLLLVYENLHNCVLGEFVLGECTLGGRSITPDIPDVPDVPDIPDIPDIPGGSESADYIRSGEIYSGEVV